MMNLRNLPLHMHEVIGRNVMDLVCRFVAARRHHSLAHDFLSFVY
jgi:hypothetical protein